VANGLKPGTYAGNYRIGDEIARGGFGTVYRATDETSAREVALKVLHAELVSAPALVARFHREVHAVRQLAHPNIIEIYDVGELPGGQPYFTMELLHGASLRQHIRQRGRVATDEAQRILGALGEALAVAHAHKIVHRDVKASNVFVTDDGRIVLLDFGVAKLIDDGGERITSSRHIVGSPACMAPEQIRGGRVDERADVYALGVLLYELLTGRLPFRHADITTVTHMHLTSPPPLPSRCAPVGVGFDALILRAMAKDPGDRFADVGQLIDAMEEAAAIPADPTTPMLANAEPWMAVHFTAQPGPEPIADVDDQLLETVEALLPRARAAFAQHGFRVVLETGDALLLVAPLPAFPEQADKMRTAAMHVATSLANEAEREPLAGSVRVAAFMHVGPRDQLVSPGAWIPDTIAAGVFATEDAVAQLDYDTEVGPGKFRKVCSITQEMEVTPPTR